MSIVSTAKLVVPSRVRLADLVHAAAEQLAGIAGFGEEDALNIGLAVREAAVNAIRHGNAEDPGTPLQVDFEILQTGFRVVVRDRGPGFDADEGDDPTAPENLLKTSGRGLLMMRAFMDGVLFRSEDTGGFAVTLFKRLQGDAGA